MNLVLKMLQNKRDEVQDELINDIKMANENRGSRDWQDLRLKSIRYNKKFIREIDAVILILKTI